MTIGFGHGYASIFVTTLRLLGAVNVVSAYDVARDVACDMAVRCLVLVAPHGPILICHMPSELWSQILFTKSSTKTQNFLVTNDMSESSTNIA
jgi:hypothetical protein